MDLKRLWQNFASSGIENPEKINIRAFYFLNVFSLLGFLSSFSFGLLHIFVEKNSGLGYLEVASGIIMILNIFFLRLTLNIYISKFLFLLALLVLLLVMLITGGTQNTGVFWYFTFPAAAFFLTNKTQGIYWVLGLILATLVITFMSYGHVTYTPYNFITIRQLIISFIVVSIAIYLYQDTKEISESKLRIEKIRDEAILENIGEGVVVTDKEGKLLLMNKSAQEMLGWRFQELEGKEFVKEVAIVDEAESGVPIEQHPIRIVLGTGEKVEMVASYVRKTGSKFPVSISGRPLILDNETTGVVITFRDITQEREIDKSKSEFVTLASHQLRTPITAIGWFTELLLTDESDNLTEQQKDHLTQVYKSNKRMANLVDSLLNVSRLELGNFPIKPEPLDLKEISKQTIIEQQEKFKQDKELSIEEDYDENLPKPKLDVTITQIIFHNLLANAFKYTPTGGTVKVSIKRSSEKVTVESEGSILIIISDTGYGIPKSQQNRIFTKLFRADNIKEKDTDGTGLGLFVVKTALEKAGGKIWCESEENKGSKFFVLLPQEGMKERKGDKHLIIENKSNDQEDTSS